MHSHSKFEINFPIHCRLFSKANLLKSGPANIDLVHELHSGFSEAEQQVVMAFIASAFGDVVDPR